VHSTVFVINDSSYKAMWTRNRSHISTVEEPYRATSTSPGVCNVGGNAQECGDTDLATISALTAFVSDLKSTFVPSQYEAANAAMIVAVGITIKGLHERVRGLAKPHTPLFGKSRRTLVAAESALAAAYAKFPSYDRPQPAPAF
jgi:hypothetical protein